MIQKTNKDQKRFWFHYNKPESVKQGRNVLTVHWEDTCHMVNAIECEVPIETHNRKAQPRCILRGWAGSVELLPVVDLDPDRAYRLNRLAAGGGVIAIIKP